LGDDPGMEPVVSHSDVTTIMSLLADIKDDVRWFRELIERSDGEEEDEDPEADG
jgi:hypothetical protein